MTENRHVRKLGLFVLTIIFAVAGFIAPVFADKDSITIVYVPYGDKEATLEKYRPLTEHLEKSLGVDVKAVSADTSDQVLMMLRKGEFDVACLSPMTYVEASSMANLEVVAMEKYLDNKEGYHSILITKKDYDPNKQEKVLAFTNPHSTSGYLMPLYYFHAVLKTSPDEFASKIEFTGDHQSLIQGVKEGKYDIGATNDVDFDLYLESKGVKEEDFKVLWKSEAIPGSPVCLRPDLDEKTKKKIKDAVFAINQEKKALEKLNVKSYVPATPDDYEIMFKLKTAIPH